MKSLFGGALALFSLISGAASATTLAVDYYSVPESGLPDFGTCCSSPPATLPVIAIGAALGPNGLPVTTTGGTYDVKMVDGNGQILWWTAGQSGITTNGTGSITLPNSGTMYVNGVGGNDASNFETATFSGLVSAGADVKLTVTSDDDTLVYLNGKYIGGNPGVHPDVTTTLDLGSQNGSGLLQIFYADRADVGADISLSVSGVPEPSTWAMMILGFFGIGFMAYRQKSKPALMAA